MVNLSYKYPEDIPVHFFGETQIPVSEGIKIKKRYQFICFMIFYMLVRAEREIGKFTITETCEYNRIRIGLTNNGQRIFEAIEDCFSEWVIKILGSDSDILDFAVEFMFRLLHSSCLDINKVIPKTQAGP